VQKIILVNALLVQQKHHQTQRGMTSSQQPPQELWACHFLNYICKIKLHFIN